MVSTSEGLVMRQGSCETDGDGAMSTFVTSIWGAFVNFETGIGSGTVTTVAVDGAVLVVCCAGFSAAGPSFWVVETWIGHVGVRMDVGIEGAWMGNVGGEVLRSLKGYVMLVIEAGWVVGGMFLSRLERRGGVLIILVDPRDLGGAIVVTTSEIYKFEVTRVFTGRVCTF